LILLARHGETDWNASPARVQGWYDEPLNEIGRAQARALAERVASEGLAALWTSHLSRARQTAAAVAAELGLEARVDERLAESNCGHWEGRLHERIERDEPEAWASYRRAGASFRYPGGESLGEHQERTRAVLADVVRGPLPALVVCHGGSIRCALLDGDPRGLAAYHDVGVPNAGLFPLARLDRPR